jgi:hypothetical protein
MECLHHYDYSTKCDECTEYVECTKCVKCVERIECVYNYHYPQKNDDVKFSAFFEFNKSEEKIDCYKYLIFIKFDNKMYIDIKGLKSIIMPYDQFIENKNKNLKRYFELSLKLSENNNYIIEKKCNGKYDWFFNCAYIVNDFETNIERVEKGNYYCYCNINPNILKNENVSSEENIKKYFKKLRQLSSSVGYLDKSYYDKIEKLITEFSTDTDFD